MYNTVQNAILWRTGILFMLKRVGLCDNHWLKNKHDTKIITMCYMFSLKCFSHWQTWLTVLVFFELKMIKHNFLWNTLKLTEEIGIHCSLAHMKMVKLAKIFLKHTQLGVVTFVHFSTGSSLLEQTAQVLSGSMGEFRLLPLNALCLWQ